MSSLSIAASVSSSACATVACGTIASNSPPYGGNPREGIRQCVGHGHEGLGRFRPQVEELRKSPRRPKLDRERPESAEDPRDRLESLVSRRSVRERVDQGHVRRHVPCPIARVAAAPVADQRLEFGNQDDEGGLGHGEWNESVTLLPQPTGADRSWVQYSRAVTLLAGRTTLTRRV